MMEMSRHLVDFSFKGAISETGKNMTRLMERDTLKITVPNMEFL